MMTPVARIGRLMIFAKFLVIILLPPLYSQESVLFIQNASFTEANIPSKPYHDWYACDDRGGIRMNICPAYRTKEGEEYEDEHTYMMMGARQDGKYLTVGQFLKQPLQGGSCYLWMVNVSYPITQEYRQSEEYKTQLQHIEPTKLVIWGGYDSCEKKEMLAQIDSITNNDWEWHSLYLLPSEDFTHVMIEAYYTKDDTLYDGFFLLDKVSPIFSVDCNTNELLLAADTVRAPRANDLNQLTEALIHHGKKIQFTEEPPEPLHLNFHYFFKGNGQLLWGESNLYALAQAMKRHKDLRLIIGVVTKEPNMTITQLTREIKQELKAYGLWLNDLKVERYNDHKENWLWKPAEGQGQIVIRLERK